MRLPWASLPSFQRIKSKCGRSWFHHYHGKKNVNRVNTDRLLSLCRTPASSNPTVAAAPMPRSCCLWPPLINPHFNISQQEINISVPSLLLIKPHPSSQAQASGPIHSSSAGIRHCFGDWVTPHFSPWHTFSLFSCDVTKMISSCIRLFGVSCWVPFRVSLPLPGMHGSQGAG